MCGINKNIVLLFCGIPGSGKSKLSAELLDYFGQSFEREVIYISFDEIGNNIPRNADSFHHIRTIAKQRIREILSTPQNSRIIIIDDIMYLKSMRREIYVLARNNNIPLLTIWLNTNVDIALTRNNLRNGISRVSDESFTKIIENFEPPDQSYIFDRHYIEIHKDINSPTKLIEDRVEQILRNTEHYPSIKKSDFDIEVYLSHVKLLDNELRKVVSNIMQQINDLNLKTESKKKLGSKLSTLKNSTLKLSRAFPISDFDSPELWKESLINEFKSQIEYYIIEIKGEN